jgi:hypothetical protein
MALTATRHARSYVDRLLQTAADADGEGFRRAVAEANARGVSTEELLAAAVNAVERRNVAIYRAERSLFDARGMTALPPHATPAEVTLRVEDGRLVQYDGDRRVA